MRRNTNSGGTRWSVHCNSRGYDCDFIESEIMYQATSTHAPPTALILLSAVLLKNLALTTTGWLGSLPLPRTLGYR